MGKLGEMEYFQKLDPHSLRHAVEKPFSDPDCGRYLMEVGTVFALLPPAPARLLDLGCGSGWTSCFFARRGYDVVGQDIAPDAVSHAGRKKEELGLDRLHFVVSDYENLNFTEEFDCAVFYDCLHHAVDEAAAVAAVYRALKPGGVCVASEPGRGHARSPGSVEAMRRFGVTEKDMPPGAVIRAGKKAGFRSFRVYPHQKHLLPLLYRQETGTWGRRLIQSTPFLNQLGLLFVTTVYKHFNGIVVMMK